MRMAVSKKTARIIAAGLFALTLLFALAPDGPGGGPIGGRAAKPSAACSRSSNSWGYYDGRSGRRVRPRAPTTQ